MASDIDVSSQGLGWTFHLYNSKMMNAILKKTLQLWTVIKEATEEKKYTLSSLGLLLWLWSTPSHAQGLLQVQCSRIVSGGAQGTRCGTVD